MNDKRIKLVYAIIGLGGFSVGFLTSVVAGVLPCMVEEFSLGLTQEGLTSSIVIFGAILGALFGGQISGYIGRKNAFLLFTLTCAIGVIGSSCLSTFTPILAFRFLMGTSIGAFSGLIPVYLSELAPPEIRGRVSALNTMFTAVGILSAYLINYVFLASGNWRIMNMGMLPVCAILLVGYFFIPESPSWLNTVGRHEQAKKIAREVLEPKAAEAIEQEAALAAGAKKVSLKESYQQWMLRPLLICIAIVTFQKLTGANAVLFYAPKIFQSAGLPADFASLSTIGIGAVILAFVVICQKLVDKKGRKMLLLTGSAGMGISLLTMVILSKISGVPQILTVIVVLVYVAFYAMSWGCVPWVLFGELLPMPVKAIGSSLATGATWSTDAIITLVFPGALELFQIDRIFLFFAILNVIGFLFVWREVSETSGKTQAEIDAENESRWIVKQALVEE